MWGLFGDRSAGAAAAAPPLEEGSAPMDAGPPHAAGDAADDAVGEAVGAADDAAAAQPQTKRSRRGGAGSLSRPLAFAS